jgi:hypothetical protein
MKTNNNSLASSIQKPENLTIVIKTTKFSGNVIKWWRIREMDQLPVFSTLIFPLET